MVAVAIALAVFAASFTRRPAGHALEAAEFNHDKAQRDTLKLAPEFYE